MTLIRATLLFAGSMSLAACESATVPNSKAEREEQRSEKVEAAIDSVPDGPGIESTITYLAAAHDFGEVWISNDLPTLSHDFRIDPTLHDRVVTDIKSTCGCTQADIAQRFIAAGEEATLRTAMTVGDAGPSWQVVTVMFDDGTHEQYRLAAFGKLDELFSVIPSNLEWTLDRQGGYAATATVLYRAGAAIETMPLVRFSQEQIHSTFSGWRQLEAFDRENGRPLRIVGRLTLRYDGESAPPIGVFSVQLEGRRDIASQLTLHPPLVPN